MPLVLCRQFFDGSGGKNCAINHYKEGKGGGPLAVKLGTITRDGKADVFSYDEDDMVLDPLLEKHLADLLDLQMEMSTVLKVDIAHYERCEEGHNDNCHY